MSNPEASLPTPPPEHVHATEELRHQQKPPPQQTSTTWFPLGYKDAVYQWWSAATPSMIERRVLGLVPYLRETTENITTPGAPGPDPYGTRVWRSSMVQLSGKNRALNELSVERVGEETEETLVMVHGYGAGLGFFYKNFEPITRIPGLKLYALDMLGMGNSSRPPFKIHAKKREDQVTEAENWFVDALEEWRKARKIERFTLLGHSLGGYLAVSYALKYPGRLKKLILASPVGIPEDPYAVNEPMPDQLQSTVQNEFTQDQQSVTEGRPDPHLVKADHKPPQATPRRPIPGWVVWLWDSNVSPFSFVRMSGPLGPRVVSGWTSRRFNHLPEDEARILHDYSFSIFKQKGSGEYALGYILSAGAYARRPLIHRIQDVGRKTYQGPDGKTLKETGIPVVLMYGEHDWMDVKGGFAAEEKLNRVKAKILKHGTPEEKQAENGRARVVIIPKAGHHLYLDNADNFNDVLRQEMEETKASERRKRLAAA
ncbi:hypothetical protein S40285_00904 [Stachybotrys chlorohalonatus IBT 40285]|uniref:AB hydrolase-1 domain-containing protein n=1 Tax=Stachybotrys chlorohalonatus (strain IBT 40285) TaxID=1283841 RepID=A0A084QUM6_STAC4|nr:hypothetical protein S40285_00904 [Stachybotrys chlorohalonata IBT 40285]